jgi:hypothetical protein
MTSKACEAQPEEAAVQEREPTRSEGYVPCWGLVWPLSNRAGLLDPFGMEASFLALLDSA